MEGLLSPQPAQSTTLPRGLRFRVLALSPMPHPLPSSPPSRLSSGKLQEFGVGDGSKLTLVPTVEAGLMVNGWGSVPTWAGSSLSCQHSPHHTSLCPLALQGSPPQLAGPSQPLCPGSAGNTHSGSLLLSLFVVSGFKARTVCDAGPGELDGDPGETRAAPHSPGASWPSARLLWGAWGCLCSQEACGEGRGGDRTRCAACVPAWPGHPASSSSSPQRSPPDLEGLLSHGGHPGGGGASFHKPACGVTLAHAPTPSSLSNPLQGQ